MELELNARFGANERTWRSRRFGRHRIRGTIPRLAVGLEERQGVLNFAKRLLEAAVRLLRSEYRTAVLCRWLHWRSDQVVSPFEISGP